MVLPSQNTIVHTLKEGLSPPFLPLSGDDSLVLWEEVVRNTCGRSAKGLLLIETQLDAAVLTCYFQFRTHKCHTHSEMRLWSRLLSPPNIFLGSKSKNFDLIKGHLRLHPFIFSFMCGISGDREKGYTRRPTFLVASLNF